MEDRILHYFIRLRNLNGIFANVNGLLVALLRELQLVGRNGVVACPGIPHLQ